MAVQFNIPKQRKKSIDIIDNFLGADFTNSPAGMDKSKSPNLKNMIRDVPGKIRKCMGYEQIVSFGNSYPIYGHYKTSKTAKEIFHAGSNLIRKDGANSYTTLYSSMNNHRSMGWEFENALYILDGKKFLSYAPTKNVSDTVYRNNKYTNNVVVNDEISLVIAYVSNVDGFDYDDPYTDSPHGSFQLIDHGNRSYTLLYKDKLTAVNQVITFSCNYTPWVTGEISETIYTGNHSLVGISEYGEYVLEPVENHAYIPLITISKDPDGGGTPYNDLNLLTPAFTERFLPKKENNVWISTYQLSFDDLDEIEPIVKKLNDSTGSWDTLTINVDYTIDYDLGTVNFTTAPTRPDQSGEDRISITAYKTFPEYSDRINKCTIGTTFGVNGANDRLFLSGNPDYPNYDWYSGAYMLPEDEQDQISAQVNFTSPTYFPDTGYSTLGSTGSAIIGYSRVGNYLATHKDKYEKDQNIIIREGALEDSKPVFRVVNTLQGAPAIAPYSFGYLATEPIFLTEKGVYAITAYDITGEKYAQNRSFYLDGKLLKEANMDQAYSCVYNDMYWLCLNGVAYILDGLQPIRSDKSEPYATRQYVGFYRTNIPALTMWESDERLFFGTSNGKVFRFYNDKYALGSYNDNGQPIEAIWDSPDLTGNVFFKNKTLNHIAVKLDSAIAASVTIEVMWRGLWNFVRTDHWRARQFQFSTEQFQYHTFSNDHTQRVLPKKVRFKNVDKFRLRLSNNELNESFALYDVGIEFTETDNYTR